MSVGMGNALIEENKHESRYYSLYADGGLLSGNRSCSHAGAANIIREVRETCGHKKVYAYVGGLHMKGKKDNREICAFSDAKVEALCEAFRQEEVELIYTGHCTGTPGYEKLRERLGDRVHRMTTGMRFEL